MSVDLSRLNPPQREAVETTEGPLLVLAGAGSGKTRVLTHRVAWLLEKGVAPWQILAVTFTNKAAAEMKERVAHAAGEGGRKVLVSTFHSMCVRFLRKDGEALGLPHSFVVYDDDDQMRVLKALCEDLRIDDKRAPVRSFRSRIDQYKNRLMGPAEVARAEVFAAGDRLLDVYAGYEARMRALGAIDFNDIIGMVVKLWSEHPEVLARYQDRFRYVMVDEYQDTNRAQFELVRLLVGEVKVRSRNIMVVGDDDQSIYRFRGADLRNILDFQKTFPEAKVVKLEQNYRSTAAVLEVANAVVRNNAGRMAKTLWTEQAGGEPVSLLVGMDEGDEAAQVVSGIQRLLGQGLKPREVAVIYRTNAASRAFEQELVRHRLPHVLVGARKFYERAEVKDVLSYVRLVLNPADDLALERVINVPARGIGAKGMEELKALAAEKGVPLLKALEPWSEGGGRGRKGGAQFLGLMRSLHEKVHRLSPPELVLAAAEESGYFAELRAENTDQSRGRIENIQELARAVAEQVDGEPEEGGGLLDPYQALQRFLDRASLSGQADELPGEDPDQGRITLLTAHLAKGLEFPAVFVAGMYEGGFPHFLARDKDEDIEEERRLIYVAFTRAMKRLTLSRPRRRMVPGKGHQDVEASRFLREIPPGKLRMGGSGGFAASRPGAMAEDRESRMARLGFGGAPAPAPRSPSPISLPIEAPITSGAIARPEGLRTMLPDSPAELQPGTRVWHGEFGMGVVRRMEGVPGNLKLTVLFDRSGVKSLFARYAKLEIVLGS